MDYPVDMKNPWYHGSNMEMDVDIYQHPKTSMDKGVEFLTRRPLMLKRVE